MAWHGKDIQFNEDTLWTGEPHSYVHAGAAAVLPEIRRLLLAGQQRKAEALASDRFMSQPLRQMAYQPFGNIELQFPEASGYTDYQRSLDLDTGIATTRYQVADTVYSRHVFASYPDRVIVIRISVNKPGQLNCSARLSSPQTEMQFQHLGQRTLLMTGRVRDGQSGKNVKTKGRLRLAAHLSCSETDGEVAQLDESLQIKNATSVTLLLTAATSYVNFRDISADPVERSQRDLETASQKSFDEVYNTHIADHQALFRRVSLVLGDESAATQSTDDRILAAKEHDDPSLAALLFDYGRYLLIASSRPGCQPANLQGVWNDELQPPWDSKYTTNINCEMNYWPAEPCGLSECLDPLFAVLEELAQAGRETAQAHYAADGWVLHHNFDLWRGTAPINAADHGIWPSGGAWLCESLWQHYEMTHDRKFLAERAYPLMKGAAEFFADTLMEDPHSPQRYLMSGPSNSPEHGGLVLGPAMDHQLIRSLFDNTIAAAKILQIDEAFRQRISALRARIAPDRIGRLGQLQEWLEDKDDPHDRHRHVSHLWGLFPGNQITVDTPELFRAAERSLSLRGDGGTGWSLAWKINLWARLHDGDHAHKILSTLLTLTDSPKTEFRGGGVYPNLFDAHPPFQIDGNFGATSGICEMLVQSHRTAADGTVLIELLPALPTAWPQGSLRGVRACGGVVLDLVWSEGRLVTVNCTSLTGRPCTLQYGNATRSWTPSPGETIDLTQTL